MLSDAPGIASSRASLRSIHWMLVAVILLALAARALPGPRTVDDAFITFRYSRNLVEGQGFVYNPDSRVLGTTTPLFTLVMAAISAITGRQDFQWYAIAVSALADAGTAVLLFLLARRVTKNDWVGALLGAMWAIAPMSVTFAVGGMETSLNIFWMIGAVWLYVAGHPALVGVFAGLGFLTRIDSLLWIAPLLAYQLGEGWLAGRGKPLLERLPWRTWLAFGITILPWLIFSTVYFGTLVPRSLAAKRVAYQTAPFSSMVRLIQAYATPFFEFDTFGPPGATVGSVTYLTLSLMGTLYTAHRVPRLLPLLVYPWVYLVVFSVANPLIFRWYMTPPMPALMLAIVIGAWAMMEGIGKRVQRRWAIPVALGALALLWGGTSLNAWTLHPDHGADRPAPRMAWHEIELLYEQVGTRLREVYGVTPETRVASADIGAVGYFSRATIVDTVGLVTPELSAYYPVPASLIVAGQNYAIPPQMILDTEPVYLVTMEAFVRLGLEENEQFQADYELLEEIPFEFYGTGMRLYRRSGNSKK